MLTGVALGDCFRPEAVSRRWRQDIDSQCNEITSSVRRRLNYMERYGFTAEDLGLAAKTKKRKGSIVQPKYQDPKSGSTWTSRGRAPAWIAGKNYERFLIK